MEPKNASTCARGRSALLLLFMTLALASACEPEAGAPPPPVPVTTFVLTGIDPATQVAGARFGMAPPRDINAEVDYVLGERDNGVRITFSSTIEGITNYSFSLGCTGPFSVYDPANKPAWSAGTVSVTDPTPAPLENPLCYYTVAGAATEAVKVATLIFDTVPVGNTVEDQSGQDPTLATQVYTQFPSLRPGFDTSLPVPLPNVGGQTGSYANEGGKVYYTTDGRNPISQSTATRFGVSASPAITVDTDGMGDSLFPYSDANRVVKLLAVDDVGNESPVFSFTVQMDLMATLPSAGHHNADQDVQLAPPSGDFLSFGLSAAYLRICRYTTAVGYECNAASNTWTGANFAPSGQVDATSGDYFYTFGLNPPTDNEILTLTSTANQTVVYDLKILQDSTLQDGSATDAVSQALFVLDRDKPTALIYPDPDATTADYLTAKASVFDEGYLVVSEGLITDYSVDRDPTDNCSVPVAPSTTPTCVLPIAPTVTLPGSAYTRPTDNQAAAVQVTATDAAGNVQAAVRHLPVGRGVLKGPAAVAPAVAANLGRAIVAGQFNHPSGGVATDLTAPLDYAVADPGKGNGVVYLFYDGLGTELYLTSADFLTVDASTSNVLTVELDQDGDGAADLTVTADLTLRGYLTDPTIATPTTLADAFNRVMLNQVYDGTLASVPLYMAAVDTDGNTATKEAVRLYSNTGEIDICLQASGTLATALGFAPGWSCVYDERLEGAAPGDQFGHGLAVGDFNGDSFPDLAVGAPSANGGTGAVYIFFADETSATAPFTAVATVPRSDSTGVAGATLTGAAAGDDFGWALAAGDLDPSQPLYDASAPDLLVGAPGVTVTAFADTGQAYIFRRGAAHINRGAAAADVTLLNLRAGDTTNDRFGHAVLAAEIEVSSAVPSDEFVVGAPGARYLTDVATIPGSAWFYSFAVNPSGGYQLQNTGTGTASVTDAKFGWALGFARRLYGDQCAGSTTRCMAVGAPGDQDAAGNALGAAYFGTRDQLAVQQSTGSNAFRVLGQNVGDLMGTGFASADLNGDGYSDLLIGQGGAAVTGASHTLNYGGFGVVLGRATKPTNPAVPVVFAKQFTAWDVDESTGAKLQTRMGAAMVVVAADPLQPGTPTRLVVGAPGGQKRFPAASPGAPNESGRMHVVPVQALGF